MYSKEKLIQGFKRWLEMMQYDRTSISHGPVRLRNFLEWMEASGVKSVDEMTGSKVKRFFDYLADKKSERTGRILSTATLRTYLTTLKRFANYLRQTEQVNMEVPLSFKGGEKKEIIFFTPSEIDQLYRATDDSLLGMRDRAALAVFYGCGLRRNEGVNLEVRDILPDRNLLYIRKGKGGKERYVPMTGKVKVNIMEYLQTARPLLLEREAHESFFVGITGKPLGGTGLYEGFKKLMRKAGIDKQAGLHSLRHSIATHLLMNGMKLSAIARFLGHATLESTQIYTHIKDGL